jgi:hypothetical protein
MGWDSTLMKHTACVGYTDGCFRIVVINQYLSALNNPGLKSWCHFFQPFAALTPAKFVCRNVLYVLQPFLVHKERTQMMNLAYSCYIGVYLAHVDTCLSRNNSFILRISFRQMIYTQIFHQLLYFPSERFFFGNIYIYIYILKII